MNKRDLTEQEIRTQYITPAIQAVGWQGLQMREEYYFTDGRFHIQQNGMARRGEQKLLTVQPFSQFGTPYEIAAAFGG